MSRPTRPDRTGEARLIARAVTELVLGISGCLAFVWLTAQAFPRFWPAVQALAAAPFVWVAVGLCVGATAYVAWIDRKAKRRNDELSIYLEEKDR